MTGVVVVVTASRQWKSGRDMGLGRAFGWLIEQYAPHLLTYGSGGPMMNWDQVLIRHGAAQGGDTWIARCAESWGMRLDPYPVTSEDWETCTVECRPGHRLRRRDGSEYCPEAGYRRNQRMVDAGGDVCVGWPLGSGRSGTRDCMTRAACAGIPVVDWPRKRVELGI